MSERLVPGLIAVILTLALPGVASGQEKQGEEKVDIPKMERSTNLDEPADLSPDVKNLWEKAYTAYKEAYDKFGDTELTSEAIKQLQKVRRKDKKFHLPCYYLGIVYQIARDFDDAERYLEKAMELKEDFHEAMVELGDVHFWKRDWKKAIEWYDKALALRPDYKIGYERRCAALCRVREFEKAIEDAKHWRVLAENEQEKEGLGRVVEMLQKEAEGYDFDPKYVVESDHYIVISNHSQEAADFVSEEVEKIFKVYTSRFPKMDKGADRFPVIVFKDIQDYMAYGSPPGSAGYYSPFVRKLVFFYEAGPRFKPADMLMVLRHEAFHQYLHYYLERAPQWFNEGLADHFGASVDTEIEVKGKPKQVLEIIPNWQRLRFIQGAMQEGKYPKLETLMKMSQTQMYSGPVILHYSQAWSIIHFMWMHKDGKYFPVLNKYFTALRAGSNIQEAHEKSFGKIDMGKFETEWKTYILGLTTREPR